MVDGGRWADAPAVKSIQGEHTDQTPPRQFERHGSIRKDGQTRSGRIKEYRAIEDGRIEEDGGIETGRIEYECTMRTEGGGRWHGRLGH